MKHGAGFVSQPKSTKAGKKNRETYASISNEKPKFSTLLLFVPFRPTNMVRNHTFSNRPVFMWFLSIWPTCNFSGQKHFMFLNIAIDPNPLYLSAMVYLISLSFPLYRGLAWFLSRYSISSFWLILRKFKLFVQPWLSLRGSLWGNETAPRHILRIEFLGYLLPLGY